MRVRFERTGGFAGVRVDATIDTDGLPPEEARELEEMVSAAGFFDLPAVVVPPAPGADRFQYSLTVRHEGREHTVKLGESAATGAMDILLQRLSTLARSSRGS